MVTLLLRVSSARIGSLRRLAPLYGFPTKVLTGFPDFGKKKEWGGGGGKEKKMRVFACPRFRERFRHGIFTARHHAGPNPQQAPPRPQIVRLRSRRPPAQQQPLALASLVHCPPPLPAPSPAPQEGLEAARGVLERIWDGSAAYTENAADHRRLPCDANRLSVSIRSEDFLGSAGDQESSGYSRASQSGIGT